MQVVAWDHAEHERRTLFTPLTCVTDGRLKLVTRGEERELYDLEADPLDPAALGALITGRSPGLGYM
ncbi:MAG: hypothetical protein M3375_06935 [Actinomycetota bacterium]|nr:hypothetical protein [Actinomycetota bacterium]